MLRSDSRQPRFRIILPIVYVIVGGSLFADCFLHIGHSPLCQHALLQLASSGGGNLFGFGTYLHFLQDFYSHRAFAGNETWGQASGGEGVDHTNNDPEKAMSMAHATFGALKEFAKQRGCQCNGDADWKVVQDFIDVGWDRSNLAAGVADFAWPVTDAQLHRKIEILKVAWRSPSGR